MDFFGMSKICIHKKSGVKRKSQQEGKMIDVWHVRVVLCCDEMR